MGQGFESLQACQLSEVFPLDEAPALLGGGTPDANQASPPASSLRPRLQAYQFPQVSPMVGVVQLVEHRIVVPSVAGSSPVIHPIKLKAEGPERPLRPYAFTSEIGV